jgi:hypothetical protein
MQIRYIPPSESEAQVEVNETTGEILIRPRFATANGSASLGSIVIHGAKGRERRFVLMVSGSQGRVNATEARSVESEFDKTKPGTEDKSDAKP